MVGGDASTGVNAQQGTLPVPGRSRLPRRPHDLSSSKDQMDFASSGGSLADSKGASKLRPIARKGLPPRAPGATGDSSSSSSSKPPGVIQPKRRANSPRSTGGADRDGSPLADNAAPADDPLSRTGVFSAHQMLPRSPVNVRSKDKQPRGKPRTPSPGGRSSPAATRWPVSGGSEKERQRQSVAATRMQAVHRGKSGRNLLRTRGPPAKRPKQQQQQKGGGQRRGGPKTKDDAASRLQAVARGRSQRSLLAKPRAGGSPAPERSPGGSPTNKRSPSLSKRPPIGRHRPGGSSPAI